VNDDARAKRILVDTYWSSAGWRERPTTPAEDLAYAKAAGYMFDPRPYAHDDAVHQALLLRDRLVDHVVADAFVASLAMRRLERRSALGSFAALRNMTRHDFAGDSAHCLVCGGYRGDAEQDVNVFNFERFKWGGVRHDHVDYAAFDLEAPAGPLTLPTDQDVAILRAILDRAAAMPDGARPGDLDKALKGVLPGNSDERRTLLAILGYCGVLQPANKSGFFRDFTPFNRRDPPPSNKNDWGYPVSWWRGSDGVNEKAARHWFGHYLLAS
jgi:hypothetical protein